MGFEDLIIEEEDKDVALLFDDPGQTRCCDCYNQPKQCGSCRYIDKKQQFQKDLYDHTSFD
jgi:hypothetical protein